MLSKGYVAVSAVPFNRDRVRDCVASWIERFDKVEQVAPSASAGPFVSTLNIGSPNDLMWEAHLQFRVLQGSEFAWIYISLDRRAIETTGLPSDRLSLCLEVLAELPDITEIIAQENERRLDALEAEGII
jgi:hypothetical protein